MTFAHPTVLLYLVPVALGTIAGLVHHAKSSAAFGRLMPGGAGSPLMRWFSVSGFVRIAAFSLFAACGILALSEPVSGYRTVRRETDGADFAVCLDVSRSMECLDAGLDGKASRLEDARNFVMKLVASVDSARVSLTVLKGSAETLVPMTEDTDFLLRVLNSTSPDIMTQTGTDIQAGLLAAKSTFPQGEKRARFIVLVSDGESTKGDAISISRGLGVPVFAVVIGSAKGGTIRPGGKAERLTVPDRKTLSAIADASGGLLLESRDVDAISGIALKALKTGGYTDVREKDSLSAFLTFCAALFLAVNAILALFPFGKGVRP